MATCRTCEFCYPCYGCSEEKMPLDHITTDHSCPEHKPRETPLLVDELAAGLYWLLNLHHGVSRGGSAYSVTDMEWKEALDAGMLAHARYQEFDKSERIC